MTTAGYDYNAMINYAVNYVFYYNPQYRSYNDTGGDCTNFVSQAAFAGQWPMTELGYRGDARYWYYDWQVESWSWINTQYFKYFILNSGRTYELAYLNDLGPADFVQIHWGTDPTPADVPDHTMIVTLYSWTGGRNGIYLTYHSRDTLNQLIWDLYDQYLPYNATWWAHRT